MNVKLRPLAAALLLAYSAVSAAETVSIQSLPVPTGPSAVPTESLPIPESSLKTGNELESAIGTLVEGLSQAADRLERIGDDLVVRCGTELSAGQSSENQRASFVECRATSLADAAETHSELSEIFSRFSESLGSVSAQIEAGAAEIKAQRRELALKQRQHGLTRKRLENRLAGLARSFPRGTTPDPQTEAEIRRLQLQVRTIDQHEQLMAEAASRAADNAGFLEHYRDELRAHKADAEFASYQYRMQATLDQQKLDLLADFGHTEALISQLDGAAMGRVSGLIHRLSASNLAFDTSVFGELESRSREVPTSVRLLPAGEDVQSILDRYR
jgi:chromosome segregation ATPase